MSTALGIASVTHVLKDILNDGFILNNISSSVGTNVNISSRSPGLLEAENGNIPTQLNMFMYRVSFNTGWSNTGYPSRNRNGDIVNNPPLAVNLHYLMTAFGEDELHSEILLGNAMQILHENPVLHRELINTSLTGSPVAGSNLAEQIEQIKITPENINLDEISKLWTAFQIKYRPCTAYKATVVLIESERSTLSPLPVLKRFIYSNPFKLPVIDKILSQKSPGEPYLPNQIITAGNWLAIKGKELKNDPVSVLFNGESFSPATTDISNTEIKIEVPSTLKIGVVGVQVVHYMEISDPPEDRKSSSSNLEAFVLSPSISGFALQDVSSSGGMIDSANFSVNILPGVHKGQIISLHLNELNPSPGESPKSYSFKLPDSFLANEANAVNTVTFPIKDIKAGIYLLRVKVDGAESELTPDPGTGKFDDPQFNFS